MNVLRCGRLGEHPAHEWEGRDPGHRATYRCAGHVVTALAEQEWAEAADADDAADDLRRTYEREAGER